MVFLLKLFPIKAPTPTAYTNKVIIHNPKELTGYWGAKTNGIIIKKDHKDEKKSGGDNHEVFNLFNIIVKLIRVINGSVFKMLNLSS